MTETTAPDANPAAAPPGNNAGASAEVPALTIVVPAYNETRRIGPTLTSIAAWCAAPPAETGIAANSVEILVVDDGSKDDTAGYVEREFRHIPNLRVVRQIPNAGKARAVHRGFSEARGELVLFTDADGSSPIEELAKLHAKIRAGADIAIASRALPDSDIVAQPGHRKNAGGLFRFLVGLFVMRGIRDTQCGFKLFRRDACKPVFDRQQVFTFAFDVELLFIARKLGLRIAEVGIRWVNDEDTRVNFLKDGTKMVLSLLGIRLRYWLGRYRLSQSR